MVPSLTLSGETGFSGGISEQCLSLQLAFGTWSWPCSLLTLLGARHVDTGWGADISTCWHPGMI